MIKKIESAIEEIKRIKNQPYEKSSILILNRFILSGSKAEILEATVAKAKLLIDIGKYKQSFGFLDEIEKKYETTDENMDILAKVYGFKGNIYLKIGDALQATTQFFKVLKVFKDLNDLKGEASAYTSIAIAFEMVNKYDEAKDFYEKSINILKSKSGAEVALLITYINVKKIYYSTKKQGQYLETLQYINDLGNIITNLRWKGVALLEGASIFFEKYEFQKGITQIEKSIKLLSEAKYYPGLISAYIILSDKYIGEKKYELALKQVEIGLEYCHKIEEKDRKIKLLSLLYEIYSASNKTTLALQAWKKMATLKIERLEKNKVHLITEIETQYKIKELETENKIANLELSKAEELNKELEQFAYMTSHDLKAPLRNISTFSKLVRSKNVSSEKTEEFLEHIENNAVKMQNLIDSLLEYAKLGYKNIPFSSISLDSVIKSAGINLAQIINDSNALVLYDSLPKVYGNHTVLVQLFQNLIGNSIKYNNNNPKIHITAQELKKGIISVTFSDNGIGIADKHLNSVFDPFQRAHSQGFYYNGSGIGLAICKKIIDAHNGKISLESKENIGTTFYIEFQKEEAII